MHLRLNGFTSKLSTRKLFYDCEVSAFLLEFVEEEILGRSHFIFFPWSGSRAVISLVRKVRD